MPGTKRTFSAAFPEESEAKLTKRKSNVSSSAPLAESPTAPSLRRASTMELKDSGSPGSTASATSSKSKRSSLSSKRSTLSKRSSSFVKPGALETRLSGLRSGSVVGETTTPLDLTTRAKKPSFGKSGSALSKSESIRVEAVDETELPTAISDLKSHLSAEGSKLSKKVSVVKSLVELKTVLSTKGSKADNEDMEHDGATGSGGVDAAIPILPGGLMEVAISFDTTGSMYGCLKEVRAKVEDLIQRLQADIPGIRIAVIAHGDYCDASNYIVKWIDFGATTAETCNFVKTVSGTHGGDGPECYELVLQRAREVLSWTPGSQRILIMIGDDVPHDVGYTYNGVTYNIDWREESKALKDMGVKIYGVQAGSYHSTQSIQFNKEMAQITGGCALSLKNFSNMFDFLMMICYREGNPEMMAAYQEEILSRDGQITDDVAVMSKTFGVASAGDTKAPAKKLVKAKKAIASKKTGAAKKVTGKKGVKSLTKATSSKMTGARKATGGKTKISKKATGKKKTALLRVDKVKKREKLGDACMSIGILKKLKWTKWELAVQATMPTNKLKDKYRKLRACNGYGPKTIFDNNFKQSAIFEVAVQVPGSRKKFVMYKLAKYGSHMAFPWTTHILRHKKIRIEVNNALSQGCTIYIRRGVIPPSKDSYTNWKLVRDIEKYIGQNFDYAWNKYIWRRTNVTGKSFKLTHRPVQITRIKKTFTLSDGSL